MNERTKIQKLKNLSPGDISANPENPRIVFRQDEMESLMFSIDRHGIQVPITVFEDEDRKYRLIDGERRWRCASKLNLKTIPAIIQDRPGELENLLLMYNIHALREQWDYYTIASNLRRVINLFEEENGYRPNEVELSESTGLTRGAIRRCYFLLDLPARFKEMLLQELELPISQQKLSEDFFIEMERSLKTVTKRLPEYEVKIDKIRDTLVSKYQNNVIKAVTDFRQLSKIATAIDNLGIKHRTAARALDKVFNPTNSYGIREAYQTTVKFEYSEKKAAREARALTEFIEIVLEEGQRQELEAELIDDLGDLLNCLKALMRAE